MSRVAAERWDPRQEAEHGHPRYYPDHPHEDDQWYGHDDFPGPPYRGEHPPPGVSPYREGPGRPLHSPHNGYSSDQASTIIGTDSLGPSYLLEHLATFRVSEDSDLLYPADGMRRLLHMEKTSGIWTQKMQLRLEMHWVYILSHENEDTVEKFPLELIREPTAFTSDDPKELYNNIFIFVVAEDPTGNYTNSTEMHIFQCMRISAKDVVEDMKMCMSGKWGALRGVEGSGPPPRRGGSRDHIPPPPQEKAPHPPMPNGYRSDYLESPMRGPATRGPRSDRSSTVDGPGGGSISGGGAGPHPDDASSVSSESYSKDVAVLNCCFDDIERFIARLHYTAAATQELERRRRSRKTKKKDIGDGLLSMRAKPPPEIEFVEIMQKFKLSFNMLGKLRTYIHEPNAPELVHFLFTPLALIVDSSRDSNYGSNLPAKVVSPLLTREAVDLLTNCLSSRETELWQSLDEAWIIPREQWKYPVPPYQPVFSSGWAPELPDESRERGDSKQHRHREDYDDYYPSKRHGASPPPDSDVSGSESAPEGGMGYGSSQQWLGELRGRGARVVQVTYPRTANNDKELTVVRGEFLEVLDDTRKWWKCGNSRGQTAHVPHTIVTPYAPTDTPTEGLGGSGGPSSDWVRKERQGKKGGRRYSSSSSDESDSPPPPTPHHKARKHPPPSTPIPAPPPLPPPDFTPSNTIAEREPRKVLTNSKMVFGTNKESSDLINYELKGVLEEFRKRKPHIDIHKTPDVYVDNRATAAEVQDWLKKKNFSDRVCKQFDGVDGEKLFSLSKDQLKSFCGEIEGQRLFSQITIQRNISGYKTVNTNELRRILTEQRKKVETDAIDGVAKDFSFLQDYGSKSGHEDSEDESSEEEVVIVRKPKKSKQPKEKKQQQEVVAPRQQVPPPPSSSIAPPPRPQPKPSPSRGKKKQVKSDTGTLKEQIKKQRMKIIYKTDDEDAER